MQLLQRGILTADAELRKGNTADRLPALQDVRLTLYRLPVAEVTAHAGTVEAESAQLVNGACLRTDHSNYTGSGFVACLKTTGGGVRFDTPVTADGVYTVRVRTRTRSAAPRP